MTDNKINRYHGGKIYAIRSHQTQDVYIGSTCNTLTKRLSQHKNNYTSWKRATSKKYMASYKILQYPDYYIELVEEFKCNNKMELNRREGEIIRTTPNYVNVCIAGRSKAEHWQDNREKYTVMHKKYAIEHKEELKEYFRQYKSERKEHYKKINKDYRKNNQEKIKERESEKITCVCGSVFRIYGKNRHEKTKKHKDYLTALDTTRDSLPTTPTSDN